MSLDKTRYPGVKYWRKNEWIKRPATIKTTVVNTQTGVKGRKRRAAGENVNYLFVEGEDGMSVDGYRITAISNRLREIWRECHDKGLAPVTWGKGTQTFRDFVRTQMYDYAPELRFCEDHWKLDVIATTNYPGWYRQYVCGEDSDKEDGGDVEKENQRHNKHDDTYMYLPQKRGSTAAPPVSKKKKLKLKVPVSAETTAIAKSQVPTPPASASSANPSVASTPFTSNFELPVLSDTPEHGQPDPLGDPPIVSMDAAIAPAPGHQSNDAQTLIALVTKGNVFVLVVMHTVTHIETLDRTSFRTDRSIGACDARTGHRTDRSISAFDARTGHRTSPNRSFGAFDTRTVY
jgi:hypothetical protein